MVWCGGSSRQHKVFVSEEAQVVGVDTTRQGRVEDAAGVRRPPAATRRCAPARCARNGDGNASPPLLMPRPRMFAIP